MCPDTVPDCEQGSKNLRIANLNLEKDFIPQSVQVKSRNCPLKTLPLSFYEKCGLETYRPWGLFCDSGTVYVATNSVSKEMIREQRDMLMKASISKNKDFNIDTAVRNSIFSAARFWIYMRAWEINEDTHRRFTGVDNYDPKAHEKVGERFKKRLGEKNN